MDTKVKERGILKLEPRPRVVIDTSYKSELTPQGSYEFPSSPQPSVDRLSVTWADPGSMASSGVNLFHLPSDTPVTNEVKFSSGPGGRPNKRWRDDLDAFDTEWPEIAGDRDTWQEMEEAFAQQWDTAECSEDEDYSASLSAVLRQRRASVRRSRKGRSRRPSSPFLLDENRPRRRSSVFTTSSGDTAISMEEVPAVVTQEQIFENIHLHKEVLGSVKQQPLGMRRKLKIVHQAKAYIKRHQGQLQERLAQSKRTKDIYARFNILLAAKWQQMKREAANTSNLLIPWELRIKEIESHFGSVVASYFTFLRWLFWVNLVIGFILLVFVIVPECLTANKYQDGERKIIMEEERRNSTNLLTLWEFEGILKYSPIFYGFYSNIERPQYRMPLAYFLTGLVVYIYSFVAILRKMAENSRMSKLSEKEDECIFSWKLFTGWDFMIGNAETAHNRIASVILGFKEALLEEAEKKKDLRNWRIISLRALVNICVVVLLAVSAYAVVYVVSRSDDNPKYRSWWRENETTTVVTVISITFPVFFELLGFLEHYHPRKQLRLQLARIMLLNLLNLYSLIFALFSKIEGMSKDLDQLKPVLNMNATIIPDSMLNISESLVYKEPRVCIERRVHCGLCTLQLNSMFIEGIANIEINTTEKKIEDLKLNLETFESYIPSENLVKYEEKQTESTTIDSILTGMLELEKLRNLTRLNYTFLENNESIPEEEEDYGDVDYENNTIADYDDYSATIKVTNKEIDEPTTITETRNVPTEKSSNLDIYFTDTSFSTEEMYFTVSNSNTNDVYSEETYESSTDVNSGTELTASSNNNTHYTDVSQHNAPDTFSSENFDKLSTHINGTFLFRSTTQDAITKSITSTGAIRETESDLTTITYIDDAKLCPELSFNCSIACGNKNITQVFSIINCTVVERVCYETTCEVYAPAQHQKSNQTDVAKQNKTLIDIVYIDDNNIKQYNLTVPTRKKLLKLCWETMFGQELIKLTMMDLVFVLLGTLFMDFFRALFVRYMNRCWCWDLEKKFPEYGDFKIAENILHLINNQGMVWMGMFFSPGLVVLNVVKLMIMMYLRSWAVMTCNVPHEVVFRVSKSNNFYLALLLTMLFLCVLPVGYTIVWVKPSWHCGPFSEYDKIYYILTNNIYKILPKSLNFALEYIASPAIVIPLLVLLILIIYYLTSLTNSLREANNDLKIQLRRERTEERRKMFQLADTRRRVGSTAMDNTPFARWKKALPSLPLSKSIDSDDRKATAGDETVEPLKIKKKGGIFAKIVNMAWDKRSDISVSEIPSPTSYKIEDETDTDFHETLPKEILKMKDISISKGVEQKKKISVEFKTYEDDKLSNEKGLKGKVNKETEEKAEKIPVTEKQTKEKLESLISKVRSEESKPTKSQNEDKKINEKQTSESSTHSKQSDSIGSVIPVIMISTTESDEEVKQTENTKKNKQIDQKTKEKKHKEFVKMSRGDDSEKKVKKSISDQKSLRRQNSVDSIKDEKSTKDLKSDDGHKYQYSL